MGVVPNVKNRKLDEDAWPYVYRPYTQWVRRETMLVVRVRSTHIDRCQGATGSREARSRAPSLRVSTIQQAMDRSLVTTRLTNSLLAGFAATRCYSRDRYLRRDVAQRRESSK